MRFLFCLLIALVTATASSAQQVNWGAKSALLDLGMTEQQGKRGMDMQDTYLRSSLV
jgi:hypothetical protein